MTSPNTTPANTTTVCLMATGTIAQIAPGLPDWTKQEPHPLDPERQWWTLSDEGFAALAEGARANQGRSRIVRTWHCPRANAAFVELE